MNVLIDNNGKEYYGTKHTNAVDVYFHTYMHGRKRSAYRPMRVPHRRGCKLSREELSRWERCKIISKSWKDQSHKQHQWE